MKRLFAAAAIAAFTTACGLYTNVPAQIHVGSVKAASVAYTVTSASTSPVFKEEPAEVTLIAEPGSIGVTYGEMTISYLTSKKAPADSTVLPDQKLRMTVRVESSNYPSDPTGQPIDNTTVGKTTAVGKATVQLPVINRYVEDYGNNNSKYESGLTAQVHLSGFDDAGLPADLDVYVPIVFTGPANGK